MIETYALFAMFVVQILVMSVLYPDLFVRYVRRQAATVPAERLAKLYPGIDRNLARERFLTRYRALNTSIAVLGLLLLGWLIIDLQRADWSDLSMDVLVSLYFMVQALVPLSVVVWHGVKADKVRKRLPPEGKRTASLQRRRLFDFVSPFVVVFAALIYVLFAAFVLYLQRYPRWDYAGLVCLASITLVYALQAFVVYTTLYGLKSNSFATPTDRVHRIGMIAKCCVYSCIACVVFASLTLVLGLLALPRWEPFALSVFFVIGGFLSLMGMTTPPRHSDADGFDASPAV